MLVVIILWWLWACVFWSWSLFIVYCGGRTRPLLSAHTWSLRKERGGRHLTLIDTAANALEQPPTQSCQLWRHGVCGPHARQGGCDECRCAADNREVADLRRALEGAAGAHDQFFEQLGRAEDGFSVVADHYGKGLFSRVDG